MTEQEIAALGPAFAAELRTYRGCFKQDRTAGVPDSVRYRSKWRIALDQLIRLGRSGVRFDWLVFDEGYGSKVPFLWVLGGLRQRFVADGKAARADRFQPGTDTGRWRR